MVSSIQNQKIYGIADYFYQNKSCPENGQDLDYPPPTVGVGKFLLKKGITNQLPEKSDY